jgi:hypothetical protein
MGVLLDFHRTQQADHRRRQGKHHASFFSRSSQLATSIRHQAIFVEQRDKVELKTKQEL